MCVNYCNIPIFLPEYACPHRCVFCNQSHISGTYTITTPAETISIIETHLQTIPENTIVFVAFFGGSFTGLPIEIQETYLQIVQPYIQSGKVQGIRLSTRPDYINSEILDMLHTYHVIEIELGVQSTDDEVLRMSGRGCDFNSIRNAVSLILHKGFKLGLQMMIGLPGDTLEKSILTAQDIISLGAHSTRIYPTLVIADTHLATLYKKGEYIPLSLTEAVSWVAQIYLLFVQNNVTVLRVGLHAGEELFDNTYMLAGPFHPQFKELVETEIWKRILLEKFSHNYVNKHVVIEVNPRDVNFAIGYKSQNKNMLLQYCKSIQYKQNPTINQYEYTVSYN